MIIRSNNYFTGCGLMCEGMSRAGIEVQVSYEIDEDAVKVARHNGHNSKRCDITKKLALDEPDCDVKSFTYPCTKYSTIADIHGTRTGDELYLHALRHMVIKPPEVFVAENVPGMKKFPVVMEVMTKLPSYYITVFCPVSTQTWLPQKRDRLIIIGSRRSFNWRPPESSMRKKLKDILEPDPVFENIPDYFYNRVNGLYRDLPIVCDPDRDDIAPTCVAHYAKDLSTRVVKDDRFAYGVRPFTVREYARLQGLPDTFEFPCADSLAYRMIGNGVSIPVAEWIGNEIKRYFNHIRQNNSNN